MDERTDALVLDDLSGRCLTFYIEETVYSLPLSHVIEIIGMQRVTHIPGMPIYIKGIVNLRGKVVPIMDVRLKFGQPEREYDDKTCIIIILINDINVGLIVDRVEDVITLSRDNMAPPPLSDRRMGDSYLNSISTIGETVVMNIDCEKFFQVDLTDLYTLDS